jgi:PPK2 family polyphosphate:nucleotide phosphotransferase
MKLDRSVIKGMTVRAGESPELHRRSTTRTSTDWLERADMSRKETARRALAAFVDELEGAQERLWASNSHSLLVVFQGMDAAGKDGCIKHVMSGVNPQGCDVYAFKEPSAEELEHDFFWRYSKALPRRGLIGVFNRSYYEEVLVVRVHPELIVTRDRDAPIPDNDFWRTRFDEINAYERHLDLSNTRIVKIFLHVSYEEQRRRFLERLDDPTKLWKFSPSDLTERRHWEEYRAAYEEALAHTSTSWAPWYVVPADHKYAARALVGAILVNAIDELDLRLPEVDAVTASSLARAKDELLAEEKSSSG